MCTDKPESEIRDQKTLLPSQSRIENTHLQKERVPLSFTAEAFSGESGRRRQVLGSVYVSTAVRTIRATRVLFLLSVRVIPPTHSDQASLSHRMDGMMFEESDTVRKGRRPNRGKQRIHVAVHPLHQSTTSDASLVFRIPRKDIDVTNRCLTQHFSFLCPLTPI